MPARRDPAARLKGKPAAVVDRLPGRAPPRPRRGRLRQPRRDAGRMHLAGADFGLRAAQPARPRLVAETVPVVLPFLDPPQAALMRGRARVPAAPGRDRRPTRRCRAASIHADLFRDNVMFEGGALTGLFDFYFAGVDSFLFDIAVCLNDWCIDLESGPPRRGPRRRRSSPPTTACDRSRAPSCA